MLRIAMEYWWVPCGTEAPGHLVGDWNGGYAYNEGQCVTATDSSALADALECACPEVRIRAAKMRGFASFCRGGYFSIY